MDGGDEHARDDEDSSNDEQEYEEEGEHKFTSGIAPPEDDLHNLEFYKHGYKDGHEDVEDSAHESDNDRREIPNDQNFPVDCHHDGDSTLQEFDDELEEFDDELEDVTNNKFLHWESGP